MNFIFEWQNNILRTSATSELNIVFARENKIHTFKPPCIMFFLLYRQKDIDKIIEENYRNYVIDKLTCEMENKPLGSRMLFL